MKILLTGSNGFFGQIIIKALQRENIFFTLSTNSGDYPIFLDKNIPSFREEYDLIIHAAGKAHSEPKTEAEKKHFFDVNNKGTLNLLQGLKKSGIPKKFVFISSVAVYGQDFGSIISEEHILKAKDPYGVSKIKAEENIIEWCKENNVICTILRLPLLIGENPLGNLRAMIKAIEKGYYFNIAGGGARKSMVLAKDVADFIPKVSEIGGIYNLTDGTHPSFYELSKVISKQKGKKMPFNLPMSLARTIGKIGDLLGNKFPINTSRLKKITSDLTFDDSKARKKIGWNPMNVLKYLENNNL
ncbi:NAD-dependent epimerase/dehydratase family protein [Flavobacterium ginsengiterrae]|uniref:NAD-dependent epimerase/dehydratase family protein n=1 Tax=Flavobacterium ginsengiterrae TaxID=871695 RepID=A0ABP7H657_9FLAO